MTKCVAGRRINDYLLNKAGKVTWTLPQTDAR